MIRLEITAAAYEALAALATRGLLDPLGGWRRRPSVVLGAKPRQPINNLRGASKRISSLVEVARSTGFD
jgi:hypothetical protein